MLHTVNVALQVLPSSETKHPYEIVDKAIEIIKSSGVKYRVCPFETVMEGDYDSIMEVVKKVQLECLNHGAETMISFLKIQVNKNQDLHFEDKTRKHD
ncbi:hypothetical protein ES705_09709 [subsurface metagenome]